MGNKCCKLRSTSETCFEKQNVCRQTNLPLRFTFQVQERYTTLSNNCIIRLLPRMRLSFLICENCLFGNFFYATRNDDRDKNTKIADDIDKTVTDANH